MLLLHLGLLLARVQRVAIYFCVVDDSRILDALSLFLRQFKHEPIVLSGPVLGVNQPRRLRATQNRHTILQVTAPVKRVKRLGLPSLIPRSLYVFIGRDVKRRQVRVE